MASTTRQTPAPTSRPGRRGACVGLILALVAVVSTSPGCGSDEPTDADKVEDNANLFGNDHVFEVAIETSAADMALVRADDPGLTHFLEPSCREGPRPPSFTYVPATVTVDGKRLQGAQVRKKGFLGSMESRRPSFKVKLAKGDSVGGLKTLTLNNNMQVGNYVAECLTYGLFRKAGLAAPRCGYAHVTVNGEDHGVYVHVESIAKPLLERHFNDASGHIYEQTFADYEDGALHLLERKNQEEVTERPYLQAIADVLAKSADATLLDDLGKLVDLDAYFAFWAMEVLTGHWDGYHGNRNNSYAYWQPSNGKLYLLPWGVDASLQTSNNFWGSSLGESKTMPRAVFAHSAFGRRLYRHEGARKRYFAALGKLLAEVWDETALLAEIDAILATVSPFIGADELALVQKRVEIVRIFIQDQRALLQPAVDGDHPAFDLTSVQLPLCGTNELVIEGEFETQWGTAGTDPLKHGKGKVSEVLSGVKTDLALAVGTAGTVPWPIPGNQVQILVGAGPLTIGNFIALEIKVDPAQIQKGNTVKLNYGLAGASVARVELGSMTITPYGYVLDGEMTFLEAGLGDGDTLKFQFRAPVGAIHLVPIPK